MTTMKDKIYLAVGAIAITVAMFLLVIYAYRCGRSDGAYVGYHDGYDSGYEVGYDDGHWEGMRTGKKYANQQWEGFVETAEGGYFTCEIDGQNYIVRPMIEQ